MPIQNGFVDVAYGIKLGTDPELMFVTHAWSYAGAVPTVEECEGHYGRFTNRIRTCYSSAFTFPECRFTFGTPTGNVPIVVNPDVPVVGNRAAIDTLPNNCALIVRKATALGGRKNRGRLFFPSPAEVNVGSEGNANSTERVLYQTAVDNWQADEATAAIFDPVLLHSDGITTPTTVVGWQVQTKIGTQRRRMRP